MITIVVIVVIASIAIAVTVGNNGLVNMALIAKNENTKGIVTIQYTKTTPTPAQ